jgi:hypothetical protein
MLLCCEIFRSKTRRDLEFMVGGKSAREYLSEVVGIGELLAAAAAASRLGFEHPKRTSSSICLTFGVEEVVERRLLEE